MIKKNPVEKDKMITKRTMDNKYKTKQLKNKQ